MAYTVFVRNWWKRADPSTDGTWPNGLAPDPRAKRTTIARDIRTEEEARRIAQRWNATHKPGPLSRKAEFTSEG
jgi:hypothetical protein